MLFPREKLNCLEPLLVIALFRDCDGFPYLAESSYNYLATDDITQAMEHVTIADVYDVDAINFINQVYNMFMLVN